ncbi:hypothetical protein GGTG_04311 [Gaeumannomyces tritici R3-111a-1]|uniref:Uncharacterized protein n=1 Tax=Gaeumannomyces tritici (strain R3-111a-1) TaxID=644352 RepID=J3NSR2_GAET3|nr:hypothetical protein GGTG_04311 [Gaeumannomyces tritici R3-111a-1]EJT79225.1 hypothetical protein GGTG_04311 [Gaeumannomyces tritici R3-111a-1]
MLDQRRSVHLTIIHYRHTDRCLQPAGASVEGPDIATDTGLSNPNGQQSDQAWE